MFRNCVTTTDRGSLGEARAIYEYVKLGYIVSTPINDKAKYDLIVDTGTELLKVQVKTTTKKKDKGYEVRLESSYANRNSSVRTPREDADYDLLFVLDELGNAWSIPVAGLNGAKTGIVVGNTKYNEYKVG